MDKQQMKDIGKILLIILGLLILVPFLINGLMKSCRFSTAVGLENSHWLTFWGSYIGSAFGILTTMLVFLFTFLQNQKQHHHTQQMMQQQTRLSVLPILNVEITKFEDSPRIHYFTDIPCIDCTGDIVQALWLEKGIHLLSFYENSDPVRDKLSGLTALDRVMVLTLKITNISPSPICNLKLAADKDKPFTNFIKAGGEFIIYAFCRSELISSSEDSSIAFEDLKVPFSFQDVIQNQYEQELKIRLSFDINAADKEEIDYVTLSAPILKEPVFN